MIALLLFAVIPYSDIVIAEQHVEMIEINHLYDNCGKHTFNQLIFWQISDRDAGEMDVLEWRFQKRPQQIPRRDYKNGGYVLMWCDGRTMRYVRSNLFRETWTQFDPEVDQRHFLALDNRKGLLLLKLNKKAND